MLKRKIKSRHGENIRSTGSTEPVNTEAENNTITNIGSYEEDKHRATADYQNPSGYRRTRVSMDQNERNISKLLYKPANRDRSESVEYHTKSHRNGNCNPAVSGSTVSLPCQKESSYEDSSKSFPSSFSSVRSSSFERSEGNSSCSSSCNDTIRHERVSWETDAQYSSDGYIRSFVSSTSDDEAMMKNGNLHKKMSRQYLIESRKHEHRLKVHKSQIQRWQSRNHSSICCSPNEISHLSDTSTEGSATLSICSLSTSREREYSSAPPTSSMESAFRQNSLAFALTSCLPFEIFIHVCSFLREEDCRTLLEVNRRLASAITHADGSIWRALCLNQWQYKQGFQKFVMQLDHLKRMAIISELEILSLQQHMMMSAERGCHHAHNHHWSFNQHLSAQKTEADKKTNDEVKCDAGLDTANKVKNGYSYASTSKGSDLVSTYGNTTLLAHRRHDAFWRMYQHQLQKKKKKEERQCRRGERNSKEHSEDNSRSTSTSSGNWDVDSDDSASEESNDKGQLLRGKHTKERIHPSSFDDDNKSSVSCDRSRGAKSIGRLNISKQSKEEKKCGAAEVARTPDAQRAYCSENRPKQSRSKHSHRSAKNKVRALKRHKMSGKGKRGQKHRQRGRNRQRSRCGQRAKLRRRHKKSSRKRRQKKYSGHHSSRRAAIHKASKSARRRRRHRRSKQKQLLRQKQNERTIPYQVGRGYHEEEDAGDLLNPTPTYAAIQSTTPALSAARQIVSSPTLRPAVLTLPLSEPVGNKEEKYPRTPQIGSGEQQARTAQSSSGLYWWEMNPAERQRVLCGQQIRRDKAFHDGSSSSNQSSSHATEDCEEALWASFDLADAYSSSVSYLENVLSRSTSSSGTRGRHSRRVSYARRSHGDAPTVVKDEYSGAVRRRSAPSGVDLKNGKKKGRETKNSRTGKRVSTLTAASKASSAGTRPHPKYLSHSRSNDLVDRCSAKNVQLLECDVSSHASSDRSCSLERGSISLKSNGETRYKAFSQLNKEGAAQDGPNSVEDVPIHQTIRPAVGSRSSSREKMCARATERAHPALGSPPNPSSATRPPADRRHSHPKGVGGFPGRKEPPVGGEGLFSKDADPPPRGRKSTPLWNRALLAMRGGDGYPCTPASADGHDPSSSFERDMRLTRSKSVLIHALTKHGSLFRLHPPPSHGKGVGMGMGMGGSPPSRPGPCAMDGVLCCGCEEGVRGVQALGLCAPPSLSSPVAHSLCFVPPTHLGAGGPLPLLRRSSSLSSLAAPVPQPLPEAWETGSELETDSKIDSASPISWKFAYYMSRREARRRTIVLQDLLEGVWMVCFRKSGQTHPARFLRDRRLLVYPALFGPANNPPSGPTTRGRNTTGTTTEDLFGPPLNFHILHGGALLAVNNFDPLKVFRRSHLAAATAAAPSQVKITNQHDQQAGQAQNDELRAQPVRTREGGVPYPRTGIPAQNAAEAFAREPWDTLKRIRQEASRIQKEQNEGLHCSNASSSFPNKFATSGPPQTSGDMWPSVSEVISRIKARNATKLSQTGPCGDAEDSQGDSEGGATVYTAKTLEEHEAEFAELQQWEIGGVGDVGDDWGWTMSNLHVKIFSIDAQSPFYVKSLRRIAGIGIV